MAPDDRPERYPFASIEAKWQRVWEDSKQFKVAEDRSRLGKHEKDEQRSGQPADEGTAKDAHNIHEKPKIGG